MHQIQVNWPVNFYRRSLTLPSFHHQRLWTASVCEQGIQNSSECEVNEK